MNCYNGEKHLSEAVNSVINQVYNNWEIIFWDNVSTDSSAEIIKSYDDPRIKYYCAEKNIPLGGARNKAIEKSMGKYIAFLDVDDLWLPEKLLLQIPLFEKNSKVGLVYSDAIWFNSENGKEKLSLKQNNKLRGNCFRELLTNYLMTQSSIVIKKEALISQAEWFDERFHLLEEADLFRRISYYWELDFIDKPLAKWRIHNESSTWTMYDKIQIEGEMMLSKFAKIFPDFDVLYAKEIRHYMSVMKRRQAISLWQRNNNLLARKALYGFTFTSKKNIALFILTFFPYKLYSRALNFFSLRLK
jgi:glycosyltransferase involved in cell wall biosynthesis